MSFHTSFLLRDREDDEMIDRLYVRKGLVKPLEEFLKKAKMQMEEILKSRPAIKPLVRKKTRSNQNRQRSTQILSGESSSVVTCHAFLPLGNDEIPAHQSHSAVSTANAGQFVKALEASFERNRQELGCLKSSALPPFNDNSESSLIPSQANPSSPQAAAQAPPGPPALPKNEAESKSSASKASDMAMSPPFLKPHFSKGSHPSELKKRKNSGGIDRNSKLGRAIRKQTAKKSTTQGMKRRCSIPCKVVLIDVATYVEEVLKGYPSTCSGGTIDAELPRIKKKCKRIKDVAEGTPPKKARKLSSSDSVVPKIKISLKPPSSEEDTAKIVDKENAKVSKDNFAGAKSFVSRVENQAKNDGLESRRITGSLPKELTPNHKIESPLKLDELSDLEIPQNPVKTGEVVFQNTALITTKNREGGTTVLVAQPPIVPRHKLKPPSPPLSSILTDNNANSRPKDPNTRAAPLKKYIKLADYRKRKLVKNLMANNNNNSLEQAEEEHIATCLPMDQTPSSDLDVASRKLTSLQFIGCHNSKKVLLEMAIPTAWDNLICVLCDMRFQTPREWSQHVSTH